MLIYRRTLKYALHELLTRADALVSNRYINGLYPIELLSGDNMDPKYTDRIISVGIRYEQPLRTPKYALCELFTHLYTLVSKGYTL